uniref:ATP synthase subunit a n=1 Tax=Longidorus vineacola TaxID=241698 RepID=A0A1P8C758_9BILA|nr:ATP synthase F0 subunit 6 [Longidorus vineacola]AOT84231.1 ATP synthase F0 subunit 6 [Longidorus vineacola]
MAFYMTTLFNLFCPMVFSLMSVKGAALSIMTLTMVTMLMVSSFAWVQGVVSGLLVSSLPTLFLFSWLLTIVSLNIFSMVCYSYPVTTTLMFNLTAAISLWLISLLMLVSKYTSMSSVLPSNSPSYLVPFLSLVEVVSMMIRPVTLCFRLLANMSAGHILLALITKMDYGWVMGVPFGLLELMVCLVQAFVFVMLVVVYIDEALSH